MEPVTLRVAEARELLSLLPHRLGFAPRESVVVVSLRPPRSRVGLVARVDLARFAAPDEAARTARALVGHLGRDGAASAVVVLYVPSDPRVAPRADVDAAVAALTAAAEPAVGRPAVWAVTATGYLALGCTDLSCCPVHGRPLRELESTQVGAAMVVAGSVVLATRAEVGLGRPAQAAARRATARARGRADGRRATAAAAGGPGPLAAWRADALAAWRRLVAAAADGSTPAPPDLGRVEAGLTDTAVRDAVLVTLVAGTGDLAERTLVVDDDLVDDDAAGTGSGGNGGRTGGAHGAEVGAALAAVVDPDVGVRPPAASAAHVRALEAVVAHGRADGQAPARTLLALLAWWHGDGTRAAVHVEAALAHEPRHRLALLLQDVVAAGLPPGWARRPDPAASA